MNIVIRKPRVEDTKVLVRLLTKMADYHHSFDPIWRAGRGNSAFMRKNVRKYMLKPRRGTQALVMVVDGKVAGYATAEIQRKGSHSAPVGHIGSVYVDTPYRKLGLARMALERFYRYFRARGIRLINLGVDAKNKLGITAWRKLGFKNWRYLLYKRI